MCPAMTLWIDRKLQGHGPLKPSAEQKVVIASQVFLTKTYGPNPSLARLPDTEP